MAQIQTSRLDYGIGSREDPHAMYGPAASPKQLIFHSLGSWGQTPTLSHSWRRTRALLLQVTIPSDYVSGICIHIYSFDRVRHWLSDYLFSSAVLAASSSLVCNIIVVNACSGPRRGGPGTYSRWTGVDQCFNIRLGGSGSLEGFEPGLGGEPSPGFGSLEIAGIVGFLGVRCVRLAKHLSKGSSSDGVPRDEARCQTVVLERVSWNRFCQT